MIDLLGLKKETKVTTEEEFYDVVSAIAQFIEKVDNEKEVN